MTLKLHELIRVTLVSGSPTLVEWKNHDYEINKIGLHHTYRKGDILYHVFSVTTDHSFLRLVFNTKNLNWHLEEISDGF